MTNQERDQCNCALREITRHLRGLAVAMSVLGAAGGAVAAADSGGGPAVSVEPDAVFLPDGASARVDENWLQHLIDWLQIIRDLIDTGVPLCGDANREIGQVCDLFAARGWPQGMSLTQVVLARAAIAGMRTLLDAPDMAVVDSAHVERMKSTLTTMERCLPFRLE